MSIIQILVRTGILLLCSIVQLFGVVTEGLGKLFSAIGECMEALQQKLMTQLDKPKKKKPETYDTFDEPL